VIKELSPSIVRKIWGGTKLEKMKGLSLLNKDLDPIGETLEIFEHHLPYVAKFIDTSEELSIQVHPNDEYARLHENSSGKTECWIILDSGEEAGIFLGLKSHVSRKNLVEALREKKAINELLNFYPVKKGDFFFVPSGSIHAIGKNITLAEIQQNSGITYRVWDWDRLDSKGMSRELHIEKSLDVINFDSKSNSSEFFRIKNNLFDLAGLHEVCIHPDFQLYILNLKKNEVYQKDLSTLTRQCSILNLDGVIDVNQVEVKSFGAVTLEKEFQLSITAKENGSLLIIF
jgi:mannose-6-phosphate isomerase